MTWPLSTVFWNKPARQKSLIEVEHRLVMPDGRIKHVQMIANPLFKHGGRVEYVGALMDVTASTTRRRSAAAQPGKTRACDTRDLHGGTGRSPSPMKSTNRWRR